MMTNNIDGRLTRVLAGVLAVGRDEITEETSCQEVPSWDSLNILKLVMAVETEFGIQVSADEATEFTSVAAIREIISQKTAARPE